MAKSYIADHLEQSDLTDEDLEFIVNLCQGHDDLIGAKFRSRHSNRKTYIATVRFNELSDKPITSWYCTCVAGGREVGMCSQIAALIWHMGVEAATVPTATHPLLASRLLTIIDNSTKFSDDENQSDNDANTRAYTTATGELDDEESN